MLSHINWANPTPPSGYKPGIGRGAKGFQTSAELSAVTKVNKDELAVVREFDSVQDRIDKIKEATRNAAAAKKKSSSNKAAASALDDDVKAQLFANLGDLDQLAKLDSVAAWSTLPTTTSAAHGGAQPGKEGTEVEAEKVMKSLTGVNANAHDEGKEQEKEQHGHGSELANALAEAHAGFSKNSNNNPAAAEHGNATATAAATITQEAKEIFYERAKHSFGDAEPWVAYSQLLRQQEGIKGYREAKRAIEEGLKTFPNSPSVWNEYITVLERGAKREDVLTAIRKSVAACATEASLWMRLIGAEVLESRRGEAVKEALTQCGDASESEPIWLVLVELEGGEDAKAKKKLLKAAIQTCAKLPRVWIHFIAMTDGLEKKQQLLRSALENNPTCVDLWLYCAEVDPASTTAVMHRAIRTLSELKTRDDWLVIATEKAVSHPAVARSILSFFYNEERSSSWVKDVQLELLGGFSPPELAAAGPTLPPIEPARTRNGLLVCILELALEFSARRVWKEVSVGLSLPAEQIITTAFLRRGMDAMVSLITNNNTDNNNSGSNSQDNNNNSRSTRDEYLRLLETATGTALFIVVADKTRDHGGGSAAGSVVADIDSLSCLLQHVAELPLSFLTLLLGDNKSSDSNTLDTASVAAANMERRRIGAVILDKLEGYISCRLKMQQAEDENSSAATEQKDASVKQDYTVPLSVLVARHCIDCLLHESKQKQQHNTDCVEPCLNLSPFTTTAANQTQQQQQDTARAMTYLEQARTYTQRSTTRAKTKTNNQTSNRQQQQKKQQASLVVAIDEADAWVQSVALACHQRRFESAKALAEEGLAVFPKDQRLLLLRVRLTVHCCLAEASSPPSAATSSRVDGATATIIRNTCHVATSALPNAAALWAERLRVESEHLHNPNAFNILDHNAVQLLAGNATSSSASAASSTNSSESVGYLRWQLVQLELRYRDRSAALREVNRLLGSSRRTDEVLISRSIDLEPAATRGKKGRDVVVNNQDSDAVKLSISRIYLVHDRTPQCIGEVLKALKLNPRNGDAWAMLYCLCLEHAEKVEGVVTSMFSNDNNNNNNSAAQHSSFPLGKQGTRWYDTNFIFNPGLLTTPAAIARECEKVRPSGGMHWHEQASRVEHAAFGTACMFAVGTEHLLSLVGKEALRIY